MKYGQSNRRPDEVFGVRAKWPAQRVWRIVRGRLRRYEQTGDDLQDLITEADVEREPQQGGSDEPS